MRLSVYLMGHHKSHLEKNSLDLCVIQERKLENYQVGVQLQDKESEKVRGLGKSGVLANL